LQSEIIAEVFDLLNCLPIYYLLIQLAEFAQLAEFVQLAENIDICL